MNPGNFVFKVEMLNYKDSDGEPIWFYMCDSFNRNYFIQFMGEIDSNPTTSRESNKKQAIICLNKMMLHNLKWIFNFKKKDIIYYVPSRSAMVDGKYINQYCDYFALENQQNSLVLENAPTDWKYNMPRVNNKMMFYGPNLAISSILAKFCKKDVPYINEFIDYIDDRCFKEHGKHLSEKIKRGLLKDTMYAKWRIKLHAKWLLHICKKHRAKLFVMVGGFYLFYYNINRTLKEHGIETADLQHGFILKGSSYDIVNHDLINTKELETATPNYLLTYGPYWNEQTNFPFEKKFAIGNPYRDMKIANFDFNKERKKILIIGVYWTTEECFELANELVGKLPQYEIVFRPHPTERIKTRELAEKTDVKFVIDYDKDLYKQFEESVAIISEQSTVMFECEGLVDRVYAWRSFYGRTHLIENPFEEFETADQLVELLKKEHSDKVKDDRFYIKDYKSAFRKFVEEVIDKQC